MFVKELVIELNDGNNLIAQIAINANFSKIRSLFNDCNLK